MSSTDTNMSSPSVGSLRQWRERFGINRVAGLLDRPYVTNLALAFVLLIAAWFRFHGLNWDEGRHLHPDERFLSTVTNDLQWPENFDNYFDPTTSTLSPYSLPNMGLYVYGTLPVYVVKWVAIMMDDNNYDKITLVGRTLSALFDIATIYFLFLIAKRLYGHKVGLLAAALMSLSVLNIQLSHFYTVDTFANLFVVGTIYSVLRANDTGRWLDHALTGLLFGLGLASKLNVIILLVPILIGAGLSFYQRVRSGNLQAALEHTLVRLFTVFFLAALTFRVLHPISFSGPSFWNWSLNPAWVEDIKDQQKTLSGESDLPWIQQWTNRSMLFPLSNIALWGLGVPLGLASLAGIGLAVFELVRYRKLEHLLPLAYVGLTFLYHASLFVKFMRYFLPIYPFLALFAAYAVGWLWRFASTTDKRSAEVAEEVVEVETSPKWWDRIGRRLPLRPSQPLVLAVAAFVVIGTLFYALAFSSIYGRPNSRIQASRWMYQNLPQGAVLANEHWDDWLPIGGLDGYTSYGDQGMFKSVEMRNYEDDNPDKLNWMVENLTQANYIVLSSNRLYDSIPRLPIRYPLTSRYYKLLFSGELGFERVKDFTSYPTFLGIQIPDQSAEESFSVYDHPRVQIFQKTAAFNPEQVRQKLSDGIAWESVVHLTPRQASTTAKTLELSTEEEDLYQQAATWSNAEVNEGSWGNRLPLLAWFIVLQLIGLVAFPLTFFVFKPFADRGYIFSKAIGLLLVGWGAWMVASLRLAPFTWWMILAVMVILVLGSALLISKQRWTELLSFVRARWRLIFVEEVLFWLFFSILLVIRLRNPDLWHPGLGGEKPMDLAYLTAIVRTPYFPAYDPWFSGGYINYYYFGFVLAAVLIHLTGIVPTIAYNLAIPTFFALTAMGAFSVVFNFVERTDLEDQQNVKRWLGMGRRALLVALAGALFVTIIGNLAQVKLLWDGVRNLSSIQPGDNAPLQMKLAQFAEGLNQLVGERELSFPTEWWYWNATRVIPPGPGEAGPINELPFFTFLFGDLHAHMMALPYTLLALGLALNLIRAAALHRTDAGTIPFWRDPVEAGTLILMAWTTGVLWPMNTWDFPTYTALTIAALVCVEYGRRRRIDMAGLWAVAWRAIFIVVLGRLLFFPFHQNYASAYFGAERWKGSQTPLWAYLLMHGFFLFVLVSYLVAEFLKGRGHNALVRWMQIQLRHIRRRGRMQRLANVLVHPSSSFRLLFDFGQLIFALIVITFIINQVLGLIFALTFLTALLLFSRPDPIRQFVLCMIGLGLVFTALVEVVVLKGDISRMNTVFKFYLQVWVLWAVASAAVLPTLAAWLKIAPRQKREPVPEPEEGSAWTPEVAAEAEKRQRGPANGWVGTWWWAFGLLLAACFLYPLTAAPARMRDRFQDSVSTTLDGTTYMQTSVYYDDGRPVPLNWDQQAMDWLQQHVIGIPTILEANTPLYRWGSRVSIYTGLPTVIGWDWHQKQQRSILPGQTIDRRIEDVRTIYNSPDPIQAASLLSRYHVQYIYVGPLEQIYYDPNGLAKFDQPTDLWSLIYQNDQVKIYQVH